MYTSYVNLKQNTNRLSFKTKTLLYYKQFLANVFLVVFFVINKFPRGNHATSLGLENIWGRTYEHKISKVSLFFHIPNWLSEYRAKTLISKEPETILWLDGMPPNSVFYDIGANMGAYSIYAAALRQARVFAFEPSFLNVELLFRNVQTNQLQNQITILPISLSNRNQIENLYMSRGDNIWGGAHNSSGNSISQDGLPMESFISSSQIAFSLDRLVQILNLPSPDYIKIDVDGLESSILQGAHQTLGAIKGILVEVDEKNTLQNTEISTLLSSLHFARLDSLGGVQLKENQIWIRDEGNN